MHRDAGGDVDLSVGGGGWGISCQPEGRREGKRTMLDMCTPPFPTTPEVSRCPTSDWEAPQGRGRGEKSTGGEGSGRCSYKGSCQSSQASRVGEEEGGVEGTAELGEMTDVCSGPLTHLSLQLAYEAF